MSIKIDFDSARNPQQPTIVLAKRNGDKIGKIDAKAITVSDYLNEAPEMSFTVYKTIDDKECAFWNQITNFKLIYCVEWDRWFEITLDVEESSETTKSVIATNLGNAELSQIMLYDVEINTETDISREEYKIPTVLYNPQHTEASLLHRIMEKAPHYSIMHVDDTIRNIQRTFTFSDTSIYDAFQDIAEEIHCLFVFDSNSNSSGSINRCVSVYDLESNCKGCGYRGEFTGVCPECGSNNIDEGYGNDTTIFVTADEIAENVQLKTDTDSIKNCFKLEAGDDLMTATVRNCNPNGSDYIWYISDDMKSEMSNELSAKIDAYNALYASYQKDYNAPLSATELNAYNSLVSKYKAYKNDLETISSPVKGFPSVMNAYYNTIDFMLYLQSGLMPTVSMGDTNATKEAAKLIAANLSPVSTDGNLRALSVTTADSIVLSMAKVVADSTRYKIKVADNSTLSSYSDTSTYRVWTGKFVLTNYSDENDTATSNTVEIRIDTNYENFVKQKIEKTLSKDDNDDMSIAGLFKKTLPDFKLELKKYSLNRLSSFFDACQSCIDILIEQGVADKETWSGKDPNLYDDLYLPYRNKLNAISEEVAIREKEIAIIAGTFDDDGDLLTHGLKTRLEDIKSDIQDKLDFEKYLGRTLWLEFCSFRREDKYSNDNYISDGLNNAQLIDKAKEFVDVAQKEIYKSAELQRSISADLKNLLVIEKFEPLADDFCVGNWLRVLIDDVVYKLRLVGYTIDYDSPDSISVEFSDTVKAGSSINSVKDVLSQASSMATSYSAVQRQAKQGEESGYVISNWTNMGLDATNVKIIGGADGQAQTWDKHGMLFREYNSATGAYSPEQLKIVNGTIAITDDNWQTTKTAVGKYFYIDPATREVKMAYGVNAETVVGKLILGENIELNNQSGNMSFNDKGLTVKNSKNTFTVDPNADSLVSIKKGTSNTFAIDANGNIMLVGNITASSLTLLDGATVDHNKVTGLSDVAISGDYEDLENTPALKSVATSGSYNDLENKPALKLVATSGSYNDLTNRPALATVATSGSYNDLTSRPSLKAVATSGSYNDLINRPALETIATSGKYTDLRGSATEAGKFLFTTANGVTTLSIDELKTKLGL